MYEWWNRPNHLHLLSLADTCPLSLVQDTKISSLERNIRDLEDEVQMLKTSGLLQPDDRQDELKQVEVYKSHSKFMKTKVERLLHDRTWGMFVSKASQVIYSYRACWMITVVLL